MFDVDNGQTALSFAKSSQTIGSCDPTGTITVESTTKSSSDRTYNLALNSATTADPSEYSISSTSITIPAGEFVGSTTVTIDFTQIPEGASRSLVYDIVPGAGDVINTRGTTSIGYESVCVLNEVVIGYFADAYPEENSINFINLDTNEVFIDFGAGDLTGSQNFVFCLPAGNYQLTVGDPGWGDGFAAGAGVTGTLVECSGNSSLFPNIVGDIDIGAPVVRTFTLN